MRKQGVKKESQALGLWSSWGLGLTVSFYAARGVALAPGQGGWPAGRVAGLGFVVFLLKVKARFVEQYVEIQFLVFPCVHSPHFMFLSQDLGVVAEIWTEITFIQIAAFSFSLNKSS